MLSATRLTALPAKVAVEATVIAPPATSDCTFSVPAPVLVLPAIKKLTPDNSMSPPAVVRLAVALSVMLLPAWALNVGGTYWSDPVTGTLVTLTELLKMTSLLAFRMAVSAFKVPLRLMSPAVAVISRLPVAVTEPVELTVTPEPVRTSPAPAKAALTLVELSLCRLAAACCRTMAPVTFTGAPTPWIDSDGVFILFKSDCSSDKAPSLGCSPRSISVPLNACTETEVLPWTAPPRLMELDISVITGAVRLPPSMVRLPAEFNTDADKVPDGESKLSGALIAIFPCVVKSRFENAAGMATLPATVRLPPPELPAMVRYNPLRLSRSDWSKLNWLLLPAAPSTISSVFENGASVRVVAAVTAPPSVMASAVSSTAPPDKVAVEATVIAPPARSDCRFSVPVPALTLTLSPNIKLAPDIYTSPPAVV